MEATIFSERRSRVSWNKPLKDWSRGGQWPEAEFAAARVFDRVRGEGEGGGKAFFSSTGIPSVAEDRRGPPRGWILFAVDRCHDSAAARSSNAPWTLAFRRACLEKFAAPGGTPVALIPFHRFAGCVQLPCRGYGWNIEWIVANWCLLYVASWKERLLDGYAYQERPNFVCKLVVQKFVYIYIYVKNNEWIVANCCPSWELRESVYWKRKFWKFVQKVFVHEKIQS